jgi:hypothetical protein
MPNITISGLPETIGLLEDDVLMLDKPSVYDPLTQQTGVTRKITTENLRKAITDPTIQMLNSHALSAREKGRNLLNVLGVTTIPAAFDALHLLSNGGAEPDWGGLMLGDYIDGLDLSAIPAENGGTAGQPWSAAYRNNTIVLSAFNPYKGVGDTEVTQNHLRFDFLNAPIRKRMNATDTNAGGYAATELRAFLEGANGDGTGDMAGVTTAAFLNALKAQIGNHIIPVRLLRATKDDNSWAWQTSMLWIPSENEMFGANAFGDPNFGDGQKLHIPLYQQSYAYRIKRHNGARDWSWLNTPYSGSAAHFCYAHHTGGANNGLASAVGGCAPAFCVA